MLLRKTPNTFYHRCIFFSIVVGWLLMVVCALLGHTIKVGDETRYLTATWEMWSQHSFLVPLLHGHPYPDKTPLMFWLFHFGWWLFGVNLWWFQVVPALLAFVCLGLTYQLAKALWPEDANVRWLAPLILLSTLYWSRFMTSIRFDLPVVCAVLLSHLAILSARNKIQSLWWRFGLALGFGLFSKGPAVLVSLLPTALLAPYCFPDLPIKRWSWQLLMALVLGTAIVLFWAVPAAIHGGAIYRDAIFWHQSVDRIIGAHGLYQNTRGLFYYPLELSIMLLPWFIWPPLWQYLWRLRQQTLPGEIRFLFIAILTPIIIFSLIPFKSNRYMLPIIPSFSVLVAWAMAKRIQLQDRITAAEKWTVTLLLLVFAGLIVCLPWIQSQSILHSHLYDFLHKISPLTGIAIVAIAIAWQVWPQQKLAPYIIVLAILGFACVAIDSLLSQQPQNIAIFQQLTHSQSPTG